MYVYKRKTLWHCKFLFSFFFVDVNVQFTLSYCEFYIYTRAVNSNLQYENILYQFFVHKVLSIFMRACVREIHSNVYDSVFKIKEIILKITDYAFGNQMYFLYQTFYCQTYNAKKRVEKLEKTYFALSLNFIEIHQYIPYICSSVFNRWGELMGHCFASFTYTISSSPPEGKVK